MRPKVVLILMSLAVLALGGIVVINGLLTKDSPSQPNGSELVASDPNTGSVVPTNSAPLVTGPLKAPITNLVATTPDEDREAVIEKEMDELKEALLNGESDPTSAEIVRARFFHPEAEVRKAAFEMAMHLNDRGAVPKLKEALAKFQDPREKVIIMDAIEYLQIPDLDMAQVVSNAAEVQNDSPSASATPIPRRPRASAPTPAPKQ